mmetsp:Transcript_13514/g.28540  ORF Transcript_13514/g.28540 Transcript_13514/m.28540 type:complete len:85 (-) Transcript_13514:261-515(-)
MATYFLLIECWILFKFHLFQAISTGLLAKLNFIVAFSEWFFMFCLYMLLMARSTVATLSNQKKALSTETQAPAIPKVAPAIIMT